MQSWVDRVDEAAEKALAHEGPPRDAAARLVRGVRRADQPAQGRPGQDHLGDGRPDSPIRTKCQVLADAPATGWSTGSAEDALRDGVDAVQVCRLVGGVATVADQGDLDAAAVRPLLEVVADGLLRLSRDRVGAVDPAAGRLAPCPRRPSPRVRARHRRRRRRTTPTASSRGPSSG